MTDVKNDMNGSQKHYAKVKEPGKNEHILYDSILYKMLERYTFNLQSEKEEQ